MSFILMILMVLMILKIKFQWSKFECVNLYLNNREK